jgi:hypothetical protein
MVVPRLDLSKVKRDSEEDGEQSSLNAGSNPGNNKEYKNYLDFLENESRLNDLGQES